MPTLREFKRFCGPWSICRQTAELVAGTIPADEWLRASERRRLEIYLAAVKVMVREMEQFLPKYKDLPFWRDAVAFWEGVLAAGSRPRPVKDLTVSPNP